MLRLILVGLALALAACAVPVECDDCKDETAAVEEEESAGAVTAEFDTGAGLTVEPDFTVIGLTETITYGDIYELEPPISGAFGWTGSGGTFCSANFDIPTPYGLDQHWTFYFTAYCGYEAQVTETPHE